ncbi:MAG TPA: energy-coupling factor ABC transporter ATP-binding protein, partial [Candidatus Limnocylindrales bacterium]|nr:energy-coupling factor ABC transporter ATP-binding protein [Candidatus Limnocylindrales bacterium]
AARAPARLSGGQAQLVALASVLAMGTPYLVLDEPTAQLDPEGTRMVGEALRRLTESGRVGLLIVEQKTDLLLRTADRVAVVDDGHIVLEGPAAAVLADERLPDWGVEPPAPVRLRRQLTQAGVEQATVERAMKIMGVGAA